MVTCADALEEAVRHYGGETKTRQIFDFINKHYPSKPWKDNTIRCHIMGCTVNHSSSHHYKHFRKFLYNLGPGHVRLYDPETDGKWFWTKDGMIKVSSVGGDPPGGPDPDEDDDENGNEVDSGQISLTMEKDLELFLYNDITSLEPGLDLPDEEVTRQISVESGRLDILATDKEGMNVVIELKAGVAKDQVLTQILAYIADVSEQSDMPTRGIIVAHDFSPKLVKGSKLVPSVKLMKYNIFFGFESIGE